MAENDNRASRDRQDFLDTFDDVDKFLYASESIDDELGNKTTDVEITTDLGSSGSGLNSSSPLPFHGLPLDRSITRVQPERPSTTLEDRISVSSATPTLPLHSDTPLPLADTPLPNAESRPQTADLSSSESDDLTVHQQSDSLNTDDLKRMAGMSSTEFQREVSVVGSRFSPSKSIPNIEVEKHFTSNDGEKTSELPEK